MEAFKSIYFDQTILTNVFECINHDSYDTAVALIELGIEKSNEKGTSPQTHHIKMRLDSFRILGLIICTRMSEQLITIEKLLG
jgi:hypothetical protein